MENEYIEIRESSIGEIIYEEGKKAGLEELESALFELYDFVESEFLNNPYIAESEDKICEQKVNRIRARLEDIKKEYGQGVL